MPDRPFVLTALVLFAMNPVLAGEPRSAIPWLSESVRNPVMLDPATASQTGQPPIRQSLLAETDRDSIGLIGPEDSGLPYDLWGASPHGDIAALILSHRQGGVPAARALFRQILLASTRPLTPALPQQDLLLARIDRLMDIGALDDAEALLNRAGVVDTESFRRMVDIGLLTGRADPVCKKFNETPNLAPTLPIRVFCLARAGDWNAAALTLSLGTEIGVIPPDQGDLLTMFLDPHLFEDADEPPLPDPLTAFDFVIREALALPRPTENLPAAFIQVDLVRDTPMRIRIEAAEKLVRTGAIPSTQLFAAYRAGKPAASGGIWDRAAAVQRLDSAFALGDRREIVSALLDLRGTFQGLGLSTAVAQEYAADLANLTPDLTPGSGGEEIARNLLLAGDALRARSWIGTRSDPNLALAVSLLSPGTPQTPASGTGALQQAIVASFSPADAAADDPFALLLAQNKPGEAILAALEALAADQTDPGDLQESLSVLERTGLGKQARAIAVETLLLAGEDQP